jgi:hypothetical protein
MQPFENRADHSYEADILTSERREYYDSLGDQESCRTPDITNQRHKNFTVWVGGVEVNDYLLSEQDARSVAERWRTMGYADVAVAASRPVKEPGGHSGNGGTSLPAPLRPHS